MASIDSVSALKMLVAFKIVVRSEVNLYFNDVEMDDDQRLCDCGVIGDCEVTMLTSDSDDADLPYDDDYEPAQRAHMPERDLTSLSARGIRRALVVAVNKRWMFKPGVGRGNRTYQRRPPDIE